MEIERTVKRVKKFTLAIKKDGRVTLTVPYGASAKAEEEFLKRSEGWLKERYEKAIDKTLFFDCVDGSSIYILGSEYIIRIITSESDRVELDDSFLNIYTKDIDYSYTSKLLNDYLSKLRVDTYKELLFKYLKLTGEKIDKFRIKKLSASYGLCYPQRREIVLSSTLIHKNIEFIETVVLHEIAHLKYPNHQKEFYDYIYKYMPDYKERTKHLTREVD
ncbi:MAG: M48 family metallopeptidase [Gammaproteobacteria bacterium]|nr:M48 family metallopeptidase [Gammaproteobacteria bacterium]